MAKDRRVIILQILFRLSKLVAERLRIYLFGAGFAANFGGYLGYQFSEQIYARLRSDREFGSERELLKIFVEKNFEKAIGESREFYRGEKDRQELLDSTVNKIVVDIVRRQSENIEQFLKINKNKMDDSKGFTDRLFGLPLCGNGKAPNPENMLIITTNYDNAVEQILDVADDYNRQMRKKLENEVLHIHGGGGAEVVDPSGGLNIVIGDTESKSDQIRANGALKEMWTSLENFLGRAEHQKLKVISLGFSHQDSHVNQTLFRDEYDTQLFVLSREPISDFFFDSENQMAFSGKQSALDRLYRYCCRPDYFEMLTHLYSREDQQTPAANDLVRFLEEFNAP